MLLFILSLFLSSPSHAQKMVTGSTFLRDLPNKTKIKVTGKDSSIVAGIPGTRGPLGNLESVFHFSIAEGIVDPSGASGGFSKQIAVQSAKDQYAQWSATGDCKNTKTGEAVPCLKNGTYCLIRPKGKDLSAIKTYELWFKQCDNVKDTYTQDDISFVMYINKSVSDYTDGYTVADFKSIVGSNMVLLDP